MTPDPLSRLSAGLAEDERIARTAIQHNVWTAQTGEWVTRGEFDTANPESTVVFAVGKDGTRVQAAQCETSWLQDAARQHIARHDPAREVSEVALKRLILHEHTPLKVEELLEGEPAHMLVVCEGCSVLPSPLQSGVAREYLLWPCRYILALQAIYEDCEI